MVVQLDVFYILSTCMSTIAVTNKHALWEGVQRVSILKRQPFHSELFENRKRYGGKLCKRRDFFRNHRLPECNSQLKPSFEMVSRCDPSARTYSTDKEISVSSR